MSYVRVYLQVFIQSRTSSCALCYVRNAGGAIPNGLNPEESCCHGQDDSSHDVGCDQGAHNISLGDHAESARAEGEAS